MARTQAADYEQRREGILAQAAKLFAEHGSKGASVADLARACRMSKSLIYHYYPSKEDILYAVMASHTDQLEQDVTEALAQSTDPETRLRRIIHQFMRHYVGAASRQKVLLNELDNLPSAYRERIVSQQREIVGVVAGLLESIDPALAEKPATSRVQAMLLFGMINWTHTWLDPAGALSPEAVADMALALILPRRRAPSVCTPGVRTPVQAS